MTAPERAAADAVRARIAAACERSGRDPSSVTLVAATKTVEPERIRAAGVRDAGENRVQDLLAKQEALKSEPIRWHFIGRLQRNKARKVGGRVVLVHTIEDVEAARALGRGAHERSVVQPVLVQVNTSGEASKGGAEPADAEALVAALRVVEGIAVAGLMTLPAPGDPEQSRPAFRLLASIARDLGLQELSMGMTSDFEVAVEEGATLVRVGSAIFGERPH